MDILTKAQRSKNMSAIKGKNTKPEQFLRKALWHKGIRYRKNYNKLFGTPDIAIPKYKIAIFCDGEFWHGHNNCEEKISSHKKFWKNKIRQNKEHDLDVTITLRDQGWTVLRFWENEILTNV